MQPIKTKITSKTIMDLESNPSSPSRAHQTPPGPERPAMKTPSYYRDGFEGGSENSDLYTDEDVLNCAPKGWPAIASQQMFFPNAGIHRKFSNLMQRILANFQVKLDCLDQKLLEFDIADKRWGIHGFLPFDRDEFLDQCCGVQRQKQTQCTAAGQQPQHAAPIQQSQHMDHAQRNGTSLHNDHREQRAQLIDSAKSIFKEYHHFVSMNNDFQSMRRVSRKQHLVHYQAVRKELPGRAAHQYLCARDDFVDTDRDTAHQWFEHILYSTWPCLQRTLCLVLYCFYERKKVQGPVDDGTGAVVEEYQVRVRRLKLLQKLVLAFTSAVMLLTPVGLLHFYTGSGGAHGKLISFIITCASTIVFVGIITCIETNYSRALVGLCAFVAVLASFLANLSGNGAR